MIISGKGRVFFFAIIVAFLAVVAFLASRIRFEEDITRMISGSGSKQSLIKAVEQSGILDRIVFNIGPADTMAIPGPEEIIAVASELADSLSSASFDPFVRSVTFRTPDNIIDHAFDVVNRNLPVFLDGHDFANIEELITPAKTREVLGNSYNSLMSPASFTMKKMILRDPVGLTGIASAKFSSLQNGDYTIIDGCIFSSDRRNLLMFITTEYPSSETSKNTVMVKQLDKLAAGLTAKNSAVKIGYFGSPAVAAGNAERLKKDIRLTASITLVLLSLIITFSIRKKKLFPFIFLPAIFGGLTALAVIFLIQAKISIISLSVGTVVLAITVDYALHITTHYKHRHSIVKTIKDVSFPIIVCGIATAFEFLSLLFVSSESLHELGMLAAISVITASFFTMVVMPHILDITRSDKDETEEKNFLERLLDRITRYDFHRNRILLMIMVIFTLGAWMFAGRVGFESDMMKMNYMTPALAKAEEDLDQINDYKLNSVYLIAGGRTLEQALRNNEMLTSKGNDLVREGKVRSFSSPGALLHSDSLQLERIGRWNSFWRDEKEQYIQDFNKAVVAAGFKSGSFASFASLIDRNYSVIDSSDFAVLKDNFYPNTISITNDFTTIVSEIKVDNDHKKAVTEELGSLPGIVVMDRKSILSGMVDTLGKDFTLIANISLLLILVILIIAFGRFELGFITFIPIFISWVWTLGVMALAGIKFNIFNIIISSFITGLGIDYSIYIMQGLVQGYRSNNRNLLSYKTCILISVLISISGTGVLILAKHPALNSIALISIIGLLSVVLISYTFEPVLFYWLISKKGKKRALPVTITDIASTVGFLSAGLVLCVILNLILFIVVPLPVKRTAKERFLHKVLCFFMKFSMGSMVNIRKTIINEVREDFVKPAVIVANHQSHIDLPLVLMLNPRIIVLTTRWVWNNPLYCLYIRYLGFYPVTEGYEPLMDKLRKKTEEGYSILVFPEGTRSADAAVHRFHKGAFLLAGKLGLDILPVMIHGASDCMNKGENHLKSGSITIKIFPRFRADDLAIGNDYHERTRYVLGFFRKEFQKLKEEREVPSYFRKKLVRNYIYKGPVLEWYTRIKLSMEKDYDLIHRNVPRDARIVDVGCGNGMISYMLAFTSGQRKILGIDYDEDKIELATNCISKNGNLSFAAADAVSYDYPESDVFILSDVLHYMPPEKQELLLSSCIGKLSENGSIIIRDADKDLRKRHFGTRYTEFFSTRFGYNKSAGKKLHFFSGKMISSFAEKHNMVMEVSDTTRLTSNILYVLKFKT
jgi:uncharacterized protein